MSNQVEIKKSKSKVDEILDRLHVDHSPTKLTFKALDAGMDLEDEETTATMREFLYMRESDKHIHLMDTLPDIYKPAAIHMCETIIKELDCKNEVEKGLAAIATNSYFRSQYFAKKMSLNMQDAMVTSDWVQYYKFMSQEIDRAQRQYQSAIQQLRDMKAPPVKVSVKAETAFLAETQNLTQNVGQPENDRPN